MNCDMRMKCCFCLLFCAMLTVKPVMAAAEEQAPQAVNERFTSNIRALLFAEAQYPARSTQNPDNAFLHLYRYSGTFELRPNLFYDGDLVSAVFKPRFTSSSRWWEDGAARGERDNLTRAFVNEWRVQAKPHDHLFLYFGKEKLLWGPSFLASPSNILFKDIEKTNPKAEVEGKYLAKVMYLPSAAITITALSETRHDRGLAQENDNPLRAVKADWVGNNAAVALVGYLKRDDRFRLGSYGQWTASDAVVLYYDGIVSRGTDALYPVPDPANPLGGVLDPVRQSSSRPVAAVTAGGSYTFLSGETASFELLYNGAGYDDGEARSYYAFRRNAAAHLFDGGAMTGLSAKTLAGTLNPGMPFLRRYYAMAQAQEREIGNALDVMLRYVRSFEENAGQASVIVEWQATQRLQVFTIDTVAIGGRETEFRSLIGKSFLAGVEMHF